MTTGREASALLASARWYFKDEPIAVPRADVPVAGYASGMRAGRDIARWTQSSEADGPLACPALVWIGSPCLVRDARLSVDGLHLTAADETRRFAVTPKLELNRAYYNAASVRYFAGQALTVRGEVVGDTWIARVIWPQAFRVDARSAAQPIDATATALRALVRNRPDGGASGPFEARTLWQRAPGDVEHWEDSPVLALMLNGAQGDDDEAHGGHFALITGRMRRDGAIGDWLVNNFYTLDSFSEKGIIAAPVTLDAYLADLNSGQSWYRPSCLIVAVLSDDRIARRIQGALARVYNQLYRHQLVYRHSTMNCAGISVDILRALGWDVAARGPSSRWRALFAVPYVALREGSLRQGVQAGDYFSEDATRLFPAAAFEEIGADLLRMAQATPRNGAAFIAATDIDAIVYLRIPQFPSNRASGTFPVVTIDEYQARMPARRADRQIVPVPARPFPPALREADLLPTPVGTGAWIGAGWIALLLAGIVAILWYGRRFL